VRQEMRLPPTYSAEQDVVTLTQQEIELALRLVHQWARLDLPPILVLANARATKETPTLLQLTPEHWDSLREFLLHLYEEKKAAPLH
jgi:hypothetical protein